VVIPVELTRPSPSSSRVELGPVGRLIVRQVPDLRIFERLSPATGYEGKIEKLEPLRGSALLPSTAS
jgi:hypothetical protein